MLRSFFGGRWHAQRYLVLVLPFLINLYFGYLLHNQLGHVTQHCHNLKNIPTAPERSSISLARSVIVKDLQCKINDSKVKASQDASSLDFGSQTQSLGLQLDYDGQTQPLDLHHDYVTLPPKPTLKDLFCACAPLIESPLKDLPKL